MQGVLSLVDVDGDTGGFQCVPELFRTLEDWKKRQPEGRDGFRPDLEDMEVYPVPMKAGDLLIFNSLLAHGIRPNTSENKVRMAQYIAMTPAAEENQELRERRVESWKERPRGIRIPRRSARMGTHEIRDRRADAAGKKAARLRLMECKLSGQCVLAQ